MEEGRLIDLKDLIFDRFDMVAFGKMTIPQTMQTPEMYALSIYLRGFTQPLIVTYEDVKERDKEYDVIKTAINA